MGAVFAHGANLEGKSILVVDERPDIMGNVYTKKVDETNFHKYGVNIF